MVDYRILPQIGTWYNNVAHRGRKTPALVGSVSFVCQNWACRGEPVGRGSWDLTASSIFPASSRDFSFSSPVSEVTCCFHSWAFLLFAFQISQVIALISSLWSGESGILKLPCVLSPRELVVTEGAAPPTGFLTQEVWGETQEFVSLTSRWCCQWGAAMLRY